MIVSLGAMGSGLWWLVRGMSPNPDPASLGRSPDASTPAAEVLREPSDRSPSVAKAGSSFPPNDSFELPFLGTIQAHARREEVKIESGDGKCLALPIKVFYAEDGRFVRAEFLKEGAKSYQFPAQQLQVDYESGGERILGIPTTAPSVDLPSVLRALYHHQPFDEATRINVTYIHF